MINHLENADNYVSNIRNLKRPSCQKISPREPFPLPDGHYGVHVELADPSKERVIRTASRLIEGATILNGKFTDTRLSDRVFDVVGENGEKLAAIVLMAAF